MGGGAAFKIHVLWVKQREFLYVLLRELNKGKPGKAASHSKFRIKNANGA
jgi:hypothetical protein